MHFKDTTHTHTLTTKLKNVNGFILSAFWLTGSEIILNVCITLIKCDKFDFVHGTVERWAFKWGKMEHRKRMCEKDRKCEPHETNSVTEWSTNCHFTTPAKPKQLIFICSDENNKYRVTCVFLHSYLFVFSVYQNCSIKCCSLTNIFKKWLSFILFEYS